MNKKEPQTVYGVKIYTLDYLSNEELTDADLNSLFNKDKKSLIYSFIIGMFRHIGDTRKNYQIIKLITNEDKWQDGITWTSKQKKEYEDKMVAAYMNIYQCGEETARSYVQWFMIIYGFVFNIN